MQCQNFFPTTKFKAVHDFLKHYDERKFNSFEERLIDIVKPGNVTSYEISTQKHKEYYNFENSEELVDKFLKNVRSKFNSPEIYFCEKVWFFD